MDKVAPPAAADSVLPDAVLRKVRIPFIQRAAVTWSGGREDLFMIDLGLRGVFLERAQPLEDGCEIELRFPLPGNAIAIHARCRVAWSRPPGRTQGSRPLPPGVGVEFVHLSPRDALRVRQHLLDYLGRHPRHRRFLRHPEESEEEA